MKRILLLLTTCVVMMFVTSSCTSPRDTPPRTGVGLYLFRQADQVLKGNFAITEYVIHFNEYFTQTTDEGRREIHERYFFNNHIVQDGNVWQILAQNSSWKIVVGDGKALTEVGSLWTVTHTNIYFQTEFTAKFSSGVDGVVTLLSQMTRPYFYIESSLEFQTSYDADSKLSVAYLSGGGKLMGSNAPLLNIAYTIDNPVWFVESQPNPRPDGVLGLTSYNEVDRGEDVASGRYLLARKVNITYRGVSEVHNIQRDYGYE